MPYKDADRVNRKLKLLEQQKHGAVKQTVPVTSVVTRGSANRGNKSKSTVGTSATTSAKKTAAKTASAAKNTGNVLKYTTQAAVSNAVSAVPKITPASGTTKPAADYSAPTVATGAANRGNKQQDDGFQHYMQLLSALETARAQEVEAQNDYLKTKGLVKKGKEILQSGGDLAAAQADVRRIAARDTASLLGNAAKTAGNHGAVLLNAQAAQNREAVNAATGYGQKVWNHYANSESAYSTAMKRQAAQTEKAVRTVGQFVDRYAIDAYQDFSNNPERHKIRAQTTGVTGSDQTAASFYGYRNDTRDKKPQKHWDVETKKEYRMQQSGNHQNAEAFAIGVNTDYHNRQNEAARQRQIEKIRKEVDDDYYAMMHSMGARGASQVRALDGYNSLLEYAATGRMSTQPRLTAGEYADLVDERISERLEQKHGKTAAGTYRIGTKAFDSIASYAALGPEIDLFKSAGESSADALVKAKNHHASDEQAANYAFWKGVGEAAVDIGTDAIYDRRYISNPKTRDERMHNTKTRIDEALFGTVIKNSADNKNQQEVFGKNIDYEKIVEEYKRKGFSAKHAKHIASAEMIMKYGQDALENIALDAAQRKFAEALKQSFRMKNK